MDKRIQRHGVVEPLTGSNDSLLNDSLFGNDESTSVWALSGKFVEDASSQLVAITEDRLTVGRHSDNGLQLTHPTVSGHHAEIVLVGSEIFVRDLNSTNGTLLNGHRTCELTALQTGDILHFGSVMLVLHRTRESNRCDTVVSDAGLDAIAHVQFNNLIEDPAVQPMFQPIIDLQTMERTGFEVLSRSKLFGLETPDKMFRIATQRQSAPALSRVCRLEGLRAAEGFDRSTDIYLNTHPDEIGTTELLDSLRELRRLYPEQALTLEVHEAGVTSTSYLRELQACLNELKIRLAYDDFGAGQARLLELVEVPPDVLKFDLKLIQSLPSASAQHIATIESLVRMVQDLNVAALAEGVETEEQTEICRQIGFKYVQGYLYGRAGKIEQWYDAGTGDLPQTRISNKEA